MVVREVVIGFEEILNILFMFVKSFKYRLCKFLLFVFIERLSRNLLRNFDCKFKINDSLFFNFCNDIFLG